MAISTRVLLKIVFTAMAAAGQTKAPSMDDAVLYEEGVKQFKSGQFEKTRRTLQTLINSYPLSPLKEPARSVIRSSWIREGIADPDPMLLFQEGQTRATAGKPEAALVAFQTLVNLYPSSGFAKKAREIIRTLEKIRY